MKKCPKCGTQYADVTLSFCLQDGTPLIVAPQTDTPTVVLGEEETVAARRDAVRIPVGDPQSDAWGQSQVTQVAPPQPEKKGSKMALAIGLTVAGMLLLFGIIGIAAIVFLRNAQQATLEVGAAAGRERNDQAHCLRRPVRRRILRPYASRECEPRQRTTQPDHVPAFHRAVPV